MNAVRYESPKFDFQELRLVERVAKKCWGYAYAWYDADKDDTIDEKEKVRLVDIGLKPDGCQGDGAREELKNYFLQAFGVVLTDQDVSTNTKSKSIVTSNS